MSTIYYPDGTIGRTEDGKPYIVVERQLRPLAGPLILDPKDPDDERAYLEGLPLLSGSMLETFPAGEAFALESTIEVVKEDEVPSNMRRRYMRTWAALAPSAARIDCTTETWTRQPWVGFTGGVVVALATGQQDGPGEYLWCSELQQYGVDGFRVPFKQSRRTDQWGQGVPQDVAQRATQIRIVHTHAPRNRFQQQLNEILGTTRDIITIIQILAALA